MTKDKFFNDLNVSQGRSIVINWENHLIRIIDDYEEHTTIPHGVQKDAIQNGWDARVDKRKAKGWGMRFELRDNGSGKSIVTFTDWGTTGLTGRILKPDELEMDLPVEERWGRFENLAFTKDPTEEALGARGQGKFIFLAASKSRSIVYDTCRDDGIYRLGVRRYKGRTDILSFSWEGDEAIAKLHEYVPFLEPLKVVGTRVIIDDPIDDLVDDIRTERFHGMIGETWWEIITKYNAEVYVVCDGAEKKIKAPELFEYFDNSPKNVRVYQVENEPIRINNKNYRVKCLSAIYAPELEIPENLRGISIQRGGMKITKWLPEIGSPDISEHLFGFISFDKPLDLELAKAESSTHYSFLWRKSVPLHVKRFLGEYIGKFFSDIGLGPNPEDKKHRKQREAENRAMMLANRIAKSLGISGRGRGGTGGTGGGGAGGIRPVKKVSITLAELETPSGSLRVEYGDTIQNILATITNNTNHQIEMLLKLYLTFGPSEVVRELHEQRLSIKPNSTQNIGPFEITMEQKEFPSPGIYYVRAKLVNLMGNPPAELGGNRKGKIVDKASKVFYLAQDPPQGGLWEDVIAVNWKEEARVARLGEYNPGERGGYKYYYNAGHRAYEALNGDTEGYAEYIFRLLVQAVAEIDLESEEPALFEPDEINDPNRVARKLSIIMGDALHEYYLE
jgi:hypothetical protein